MVRSVSGGGGREIVSLRCEITAGAVSRERAFQRFYFEAIEWNRNGLKLTIFGQSYELKRNLPFLFWELLSTTVSVSTFVGSAGELRYFTANGF